MTEADKLEKAIKAAKDVGKSWRLKDGMPADITRSEPVAPSALGGAVTGYARDLCPLPYTVRDDIGREWTVTKLRVAPDCSVVLSDGSFLRLT